MRYAADCEMKGLAFTCPLTRDPLSRDCMFLNRALVTSVQYWVEDVKKRARKETVPEAQAEWSGLLKECAV